MTAPRYRAYAYDPKTNTATEVPNVAFIVKTSPAPMPRTRPFLEILEEVYRDIPPLGSPPPKDPA